MKTINQVVQEMNEIQVAISTGSHKQIQISRMKKRYSFLKLCKMYLKEEPTNDFLYKESERLSNRVDLINKGYKPDQRLIDANLRKEEQAEHKDYNKIMGLPKVKEQLRAIQFLIS